MEELVVEGLTAEDFIVLEKILLSHKVSLSDSVSFDEVSELYSKVKQVVACLND